MSWDERWMDMAHLVASWSKDRSRQAGAVIVNRDERVVSLGWNGFPRFVDDDVEARHQRPAKYMWTEHAERNAIYNAAGLGVSTSGCKMYIQWYPCADCARAIIQSGITELYCIEPDWDDPKWAADFYVVRQMLGESHMSVTYLEGDAPTMKGTLDA